MKQEERIQAFTMRCEGMTWAQIGEIMHYDEKTISKNLYAVIRKETKKPNIRYPRLREYIRTSCGGSVAVFANRLGVSPYRLRQVLISGKMPGEKLQKKIRKETGMEPEEAFCLIDTGGK